MKVPPKRKGNLDSYPLDEHQKSLNESPSEKEGKFHPTKNVVGRRLGLNESPSEKEGKWLS